MPDPRTSLIRRQLAELGRRRAARANAGAAVPRDARVLVIGFGNGNTGDEAMLARTLQELPEDTEVRVVSRNPRMVEALHRVPAVAMDGVPFAKALRWCDGIAVVGGGLFGTGASPLVNVLPAIVWAATVGGRDMTYLAIGVYPGTPPRVLDLLRRSVRTPGRISVRDEVSATTLGDAVVAPVVGDLALGLDPAPPADARRALAAAGVDRAAAAARRAEGTAQPDPRRLPSGRRRDDRPPLDRAGRRRYGVGDQHPRRLRPRVGPTRRRAGGRARRAAGPPDAGARAAAAPGSGEGGGGCGRRPVRPAAARADLRVAAGVPCLGVGWEERTTAFLAEHEQSAISTRPPREDLHAWVDRSLPARWTRPRLLPS